MEQNLDITNLYITKSSITTNDILQPRQSYSRMYGTEPRFNEPLYNEVLGITNDILQPSQSYSKMYGTEPRYNEPLYNEVLDYNERYSSARPKLQ